MLGSNSSTRRNTGNVVRQEYLECGSKVQKAKIKIEKQNNNLASPESTMLTPNTGESRHRSKIGSEKKPFIMSRNHDFNAFKQNSNDDFGTKEA